MRQGAVQGAAGGCFGQGELFDSWEGNPAGCCSSASFCNLSCYCCPGNLPSLSLASCSLALPSKRLWQDRSGSEKHLSIPPMPLVKLLRAGAETQVG